MLTPNIEMQVLSNINSSRKFSAEEDPPLTLTHLYTSNSELSITRLRNLFSLQAYVVSSLTIPSLGKYPLGSLGTPKVLTLFICVPYRFYRLSVHFEY